MDVFKYINSKDIREHLRINDYSFDSLEAAWLIYECRDKTIKEKHRDWMELIETMPDCEIPKRINTCPQESLHVFLKKYMEIENKCMEQFLDDNHGDTYADDKPYVFRFEYVYPTGSPYEYPTVFSSFLALHESIMEPDSDVTKIYCTKMRIDDLNHESGSRAILTPELDFLEIEPHGLTDEEDNIFNGVFEGLWFDFPTPFKKGDIVWNPLYPDSDCLSGGPFVLENVNLDRIIGERTKESRRKLGDTSDMDADGYFINPDGGIYYENMWNYMDLEYYPEELSGIHRILIPLSSFMKGKIDIGLFARAYHQIMTETYSKRIKPRMITEEGLTLAGINNKEMEWHCGT